MNKPALYRLLLLEELILFLKTLTREKTGSGLFFVLVSAIMLTMNRFGLQDAFYQHLAPAEFFWTMNDNTLVFWSQIYFSSASLIFFVIVPLMFHFLFPFKSDVLFGLGIGNSKKHFPIYLILLIIMLPMVWIACGDSSFNNFYPMYNPASLKMLLLYELVYIVHFFTVEFFFRGCILFRLEQRFGFYAVWIMILPYSFLHIYKPFPEALGSIVAGFVLGGLALRSRSIWPGILVHCGIAFSADLFSLIRSGRLGVLLQ